MQTNRKNIRKKKKEYSTIVIVNKDNPNTKSITVATKHISRLKYYISSIIILFFTLSILLFIQRKNALENKNAKAELEYLKKEIIVPMSKDTLVAKSYIKQIDNQIEKINSYLEKRGVKHKVKEGGQNYENISALESYKFYNIYLKSLYKNLKYIPLGFPHHNKNGSGYGYRRNPFGGKGSEFHSGIDFEGKIGDAVRATASGIVTVASYHYGYGQCVVIKHSNGYETLYGHLSKINVRLGQKVKTNQKIGDLGSTGRSTGPHIHYEVRYLGKPLNPNLFLELD